MRAQWLRRRLLAVLLALVIVHPSVANAGESTYFNGWAGNYSWRTSGTTTVRGGVTTCNAQGSACATNFLHAYYATSEYYWGAYHNVYSAVSLGMVGMTHPPDSHTVSRCRQVNPAGKVQPIRCTRRT